jgi:hypothetical protein
MARRLGRAILKAVGCCVALYLVAFGVARSPISESARERLMVLTLAPFYVVGRCITGVVDTFGPRGLPEPASHYASVWAIRAIMGLTVSLTLVALVGLALLSDKVGWRVPIGIVLGVAGVTSATDGFSEPIYPQSGGSLETWIGSTVALAGVYLIVAGAARNLPTRRDVRFAGQVALACAGVAAGWLAFLATR